MKLLKERFSAPSFFPEPVATDENALDAYLEKTADLPMPAHHRLIALAELAREKLSWAQICDIYERMLRDETAEHSGIYATWISLTEHILSKRDLQNAQRGEIVQGLFSIFERALNETPQHNGLALGLGSAYLQEAQRQRESGDFDAQTNCVAQAVTWLTRTLEWTAEKNAPSYVDKYVMASTYLRLGQCYMALRVYKLALDHLNASEDLSDYLGKNEEIELREAIRRCRLELNSPI